MVPTSLGLSKCIVLGRERPVHALQAVARHANKKPTRKPTRKRPTKRRPTKRRPTKKRPTAKRPTARGKRLLLAAGDFQQRQQWQHQQQAGSSGNSGSIGSAVRGGGIGMFVL
jgi:hypothetical protein